MGGTSSRKASQAPNLCLLCACHHHDTYPKNRELQAPVLLDCRALGKVANPLGLRWEGLWE